ncbi:TOBE domain-containing protein [Bradyrhizobium zhanjiangense]|uniref:TOBE domain-containing protein n=1 Tax=Bradyrhizobium zhanjiangense TaxID=1325107 RepID=UPI001FE08983|nr:TOBE domain-containing protein [Bradyrhizobium zhanjiangense]
MHEGRIRQVSTPQEIYRKPADLFVASFVGEVNLIPAKLRSGIVHGPAGETLPAAQWTGADGDGTLCVRPEHLRLSAGTSGGILGRIVEKTFVGDATIFNFRSESGLQLTSKGLNLSTEATPRIGDAYVASWVANDATILPNSRNGPMGRLAIDLRRDNLGGHSYCGM